MLFEDSPMSTPRQARLLRAAEELAQQYPLTATLAEVIRLQRGKAESEAGGAPAVTHQWVVDEFFRLWERHRGGRYEVNGKRDGNAAQRFLRVVPGLTKSEITRRMTNALLDPWFQRAGNLTIFLNRWSNYDRAASPERAAPPSSRLREMVGLDGDGRPVYA